MSKIILLIISIIALNSCSENQTYLYKIQYENGKKNYTISFPIQVKKDGYFCAFLNMHNLPEKINDEAFDSYSMYGDLNNKTVSSISIFDEKRNIIYKNHNFHLVVAHGGNGLSLHLMPKCIKLTKNKYVVFININSEAHDFLLGNKNNSIEFTESHSGK